jgi:hypothetical protein
VTDSDDERSGSDAAARPAKARRASGVARRAPSSSPPASRGAKRGSPARAAGDPARKYCLGKLLETFLPIFRRHPHVPPAEGGGALEPRDPAALVEEDAAAVERVAHAFTEELEQALFELFAERDKSGKPAVGGRYK